MLVFSDKHHSSIARRNPTSLGFSVWLLESLIGVAPNLSACGKEPAAGDCSRRASGNSIASASQGGEGVGDEGVDDGDYRHSGADSGLFAASLWMRGGDEPTIGEAELDCDNLGARPKKGLTKGSVTFYASQSNFLSDEVGSDQAKNGGTTVPTA